MVGGTGDIIRRVAANIVSLASLLLRLFGAKIGKNVVIRPSVKITYPWKLTVGDYAWVGDDAVLYTLGEINIGAHAVISQKGICVPVAMIIPAPISILMPRRLLLAKNVGWRPMFCRARRDDRSWHRRRRAQQRI